MTSAEGVPNFKRGVAIVAVVEVMAVVIVVTRRGRGGRGGRGGRRVVVPLSITVGPL